MKYEISEIIKRIGFDEQRIQVNGLIGGIYIKKSLMNMLFNL